MMLAFRDEVRPGDVRCVADILKASGFFTAEEQEIGVSLVSERLHKGIACGYLFLFAELDAAVVGYTCYGPIPGSLYGYDLYWIAVDSDFLGMGIGSRLIVATEKEIERLGGRSVYAETSSTALYTPTRGFYERRGYVLEAKLADYYAPGDDKCVYVKRLAK